MLFKFYLYRDGYVSMVKYYEIPITIIRSSRKFYILTRFPYDSILIATSASRDAFITYLCIISKFVLYISVITGNKILSYVCGHQWIGLILIK